MKERPHTLTAFNTYLGTSKQTFQQKDICMLRLTKH